MQFSMQQKNCWTMNQCICVLLHHVQDFTHTEKYHGKELTPHWGKECGLALERWHLYLCFAAPCTGFHPYWKVPWEGTDPSLRKRVWPGIRALALQFRDLKFSPGYPNRLAVFGVMLDIPIQHIPFCVVLYVWSLLCYCVRARDHCCVLCDMTQDLLFTWYMVC